MSRTLGIDYGEKRIGLAVSDETRTLARELAILPPAAFWTQLTGLLAEQEIDTIVLGWPLNMSGLETKKTAEVGRFRDKLEQAADLPVVIMDERLTSVMARHLPGGDKNIDSLAAQILLQNYLDRQHKE